MEIVLYVLIGVSLFGYLYVTYKLDAKDTPEDHLYEDGSDWASKAAVLGMIWPLYFLGKWSIGIWTWLLDREDDLDWDQ